MTIELEKSLTAEFNAHLLLEIAPVLLVDKHQVEVIPCTKFLVHISECGRQVEAAQEQPNGNRFPCRRS